MEVPSSRSSESETLKPRKALNSIRSSRRKVKCIPGKYPEMKKEFSNHPWDSFWVGLLNVVGVLSGHSGASSIKLIHPESIKCACTVRKELVCERGVPFQTTRRISIVLYPSSSS